MKKTKILRDGMDKVYAFLFLIGITFAALAGVWMFYALLLVTTKLGTVDEIPWFPKELLILAMFSLLGFSPRMKRTMKRMLVRMSR